MAAALPSQVVSTTSKGITRMHHRTRQPRRIVYLIESLNAGGAEHAMVRLATALHRSEWAPEIWTLRHGRQDLLPKLQAADIPVYDKSDLKWNYQSRIGVRGLYLAARELHGATIVHSFAIASYGNEPLATRLAGVPIYIVRKASERLQGIPQTWEWKYKRAHTIVVLTERMRKWLIQQYAHLSLGNKIRKIPNGVDTDIFAPRHTRALRDELGLSDDTLVFVSVGRLAARKNQALLLRAFARMQSAPSHPHHLVLVGRGGPGSEQDALARLAHELGIASRVHFLGQRLDIPNILAASDVFVQSSQAGTEGMSNAVLEGMSSALPPVMTRNGSEEVITSGHDGFVVGCDEPDEMAKVLDTLAINRELRLEIGYHARQKMFKQYSLNCMVQNNLDMYHDLLAVKLMKSHER